MSTTSLFVHEVFKGKLRVWQVSLSSDDYLTMSLVQGEPLIYTASKGTFPLVEL